MAFPLSCRPLRLFDGSFHLTSMQLRLLPLGSLPSSLCRHRAACLFPVSRLQARLFWKAADEGPGKQGEAGAAGRTSGSARQAESRGAPARGRERPLAGCTVLAKPIAPQHQGARSPLVSKTVRSGTLPSCRRGSLRLAICPFLSRGKAGWGGEGDARLDSGRSCLRFLPTRRVPRSEFVHRTEAG